MSKLDSKPLQKGQRSMSSHDLGHVYDFTSSTGMILPLVCDLLNPGEKIDSLVDLSQTRTMPLDSAAYLDLDLHVDYFFVPMTVLMSKFESFIYRINDFYSNAGVASFGLPLLDLDAMKASIEAAGYNTIGGANPVQDFDRYGKGALRLLDHLGYGTLMNSTHPNWSSDSAYNPQIFAWALAAYNACYQYYYLNDEYETFDNNAFNMDQQVNTSLPWSPYSLPNPYNKCCLHYRDKYHDYFTRVKASPIVSGKNLLDSAGSLNLAKNWLSRDYSRSTDFVLNDGTIGSPGTDWNSSFTNSPNTSNATNVRTQFGFKRVSYQGAGSSIPLNGLDINTANLRALFANEKLWTITGMNRKKYDAQTLAHYGFDVPTDVMHQVQHIGHHIYNLKIGEVISTAGTSNQPLATVAGKGYAFENRENKDIRFTAPCHGVFMALYSSAIHRNYFGTFRKENAIGSWQDFYQPEYDNLGMQPLFMFETVQDKFASTNTYSYGDILGWQYRYEQFKCRYDRTTLAFANRFFGSGNVIFAGPFSSWSASGLPFKGVIPLSVNTFNPADGWKFMLKESPCELNGMMSISYDPNWYAGNTGEELDYMSNPWDAYATDPLIHHAIIKYHKISTMSTYSLPKLND